MGQHASQKEVEQQAVLLGQADKSVKTLVKVLKMHVQSQTDLEVVETLKRQINGLEKLGLDLSKALSSKDWLFDQGKAYDTLILSEESLKPEKVSAPFSKPPFDEVTDFSNSMLPQKRKKLLHLTTISEKMTTTDDDFDPKKAFLKRANGFDSEGEQAEIHSLIKSMNSSKKKREIKQG